MLERGVNIRGGAVLRAVMLLAGVYQGSVASQSGELETVASRGGAADAKKPDPGKPPSFTSRRVTVDAAH